MQPVNDYPCWWNRSKDSHFLNRSQRQKNPFLMQLYQGQKLQNQNMQDMSSNLNTSSAQPCHHALPANKPCPASASQNCPCSAESCEAKLSGWRNHGTSMPNLIICVFLHWGCTKQIQTDSLWVLIYCSNHILHVSNGSTLMNGFMVVVWWFVIAIASCQALPWAVAWPAAWFSSHLCDDAFRYRHRGGISWLSCCCVDVTWIYRDNLDDLSKFQDIFFDVRCPLLFDPLMQRKSGK